MSSNYLFLCKPDHFDVRYKINPWMEPARKTDGERAMHQWLDLYATLEKLAVKIELIEQLSAQPDMVFTANAGLVLNRTFIPARFKHQERKGEEEAFIRWFEDHSYQIVNLKTENFEGEGDALFSSPQKLFVGFGFRTDRAAADELADLLSVKTVPCELVDGRFYHLDTCFCPLSDKAALFYPEAFKPESIKAMEGEIELFPVDTGDALRFACNAIVLGENVVLPAKCSSTEDLLWRLGFKSFGVELDEFLKGGGSAKCLVLKI